jgi:hypothetical protein
MTPGIKTDRQVIAKIEDRVFESPILEDQDHLEDCEYPETETCTCREISNAKKEGYYEDQAMERYYEEKYGK